MTVECTRHGNVMIDSAAGDTIAGARLTIDLGAIARNYAQLCDRVAPARLGGVVKADAYGLGAVRVAQMLYAAGCRDFFVALLDEAITLRPELPGDAMICVLNGLHPGAEPFCANYVEIVPALNCLDQIDRWAQQAAVMGRALPAVLQLDTGMSRLGLDRAELQELCAAPDRLRGLDVRLVMSHLACADVPQDATNCAQFDCFAALSCHFPTIPRSLDNSGGAFLARDHFDLVRAGIALYGANPFATGPNPMASVVRLEARIVQVRTVAAGSGVGYALTAAAPVERRVATIGVGYADGWPRSLGNRGHVYIDGICVPVIGRVSMDSMTVDVSHLRADQAYPGAWVELIGVNQDVDAVARDAGTIAYEILTRLGHRYARDYIWPQ